MFPVHIMSSLCMAWPRPLHTVCVPHCLLSQGKGAPVRKCHQQPRMVTMSTLKRKRMLRAVAHIVGTAARWYWLIEVWLLNLC